MRAAALALILGLPFPALAGEGEGAAASVCRQDIAQFCAREEPQGLDALRQCMTLHAQELSGSCRAFILSRTGHGPGDTEKSASAAAASAPRPSGRKAAIQRLADSCSRDLRRFCAQQEKKGALIGCLLSHQQRVSRGCDRAIDAAKPYLGAP